MSDLNLVARHRAAAESHRHTIGNASAALAQFHTQTADELERLQARVNDTELLPAILAFAKGYIKVCDKEIERLTAGRDVQKDNAKRWETLALQYKRQLESLIADNAELKSYAEEEGERSEKQAKICIELQARVNELEAALRIVPGFATNRAIADFVKDKLAATEQGDSDE